MIEYNFSGPYGLNTIRQNPPILECSWDSLMSVGLLGTDEMMIMGLWISQLASAVMPSSESPFKINACPSSSPSEGNTFQPHHPDKYSLRTCSRRWVPLCFSLKPISEIEGGLSGSSNLNGSVASVVF
jgi:hypothetical protein